MPPRLPDVGGGGGLSHSASAPRVGPLYKNRVPVLKKEDLSERIKALGGKGPGSASAPDIRAGLKATDAIARARQQLQAPPTPPKASFGASGSRDLPPSLPSQATWASFVSENVRRVQAETSAGGLGYPRKPSNGDRLTPLPSPPSTRPSSTPSQENGDEYPKVAQWNFREMPLETFDATMDFEVHSADKWMELMREVGYDRMQACVVHYKAYGGYNYNLTPCWVHDYDAKSKKYSVELQDGTVKRVRRLALRFNMEDAQNFDARLAACHSRKAWCELQESLIAYVDAQDDGLIALMPRERKECFIRHCLEDCHLVDPNEHTPLIRELVVDVDKNYVQAMKFCVVKNRHIHNFSTKDAYIDEGSYYYTVLKHFLPRPVPYFGLVDHEQAEQPVFDIVLEMSGMPTLARSIWAVTMLVLRRYTDDVAPLHILDTQRGAGDEAERKKRMNDPDAPDPERRVFHFKEFIEHMEDHLAQLTKWLGRNWRDYIIAEVTDRLADEHNFFMDSVQHYMKAPLHRVLRKIDVILSSQMRFFLEDSIQQWVDFIESFRPSPQRPLPSPLLIISLVSQDGEIGLSPDPETLIESMTMLMDKVLNVTDSLSTSEHELVPFCNLNSNKLFEPLADPDGQYRQYTPLENAKRVTEDCVRFCLQEPQKIVAQFQEYAYLLTEEVKDLDPTDIEKTSEKVTFYRTASREVELLSPSVWHFPLFQLECSELIRELRDRADKLAAECLAAVAGSVKSRAEAILEEWEATHNRIMGSPENEDELAKIKDFMSNVERNVCKPLMARTREVHRQMDMTEDFFYEIDPDIVLSAFLSFQWPLQIQMDVMESERNLEREKNQFMVELTREKEEFWKDMATYRKELDWVETLDDFDEALKINRRLEQLHNNLQKATERVQSYLDREHLFQIEQGDYSELEELQAEFAPYHHLWECVIEFKHSEEDWINGPLSKLNADEIQTFVDEQYKDSYKMAKSFAGNANPEKVAKDFTKGIVAFKKYMPIVTDLCRDAIEPHHFAELFDVMESELDLGDELTLKALVDQGILDHLDTVSRISTQASKQYGLKSTMKAMKTEWKVMEFGHMAYKETGTSLISGTDDVQALLDDHIIKTQAVRGSPFVKPIEREVKDWEAKLIYVQDLLEAWLAMQRTWLYLEPIFGAEDIVRQMPSEAKVFSGVDALWRNTMKAVVENPNVLDVSDIEGLLANFQDANKKLDAIQKSLNDYLETKRLAFPRFFFLSNDELLMILSQTKDPTAVQPHMGKCFEGINAVRFDKANEIIEAMVSIEGEVVDLFAPVNVIAGDKKGNVEKWLMEVQESMIACLTKISGQALEAYLVTDRKEWVIQWPGQVVICIDNAYWTKEVTEAIEKGELDKYYAYQEEQLLGLVDLVRGDLSKLARRTLTALVTIDVHNRDVVKMLWDLNLKSGKDFDWMAQLRYYWAPAGSIVLYETQKPSTTDKCQVSIINSTLLYGFEYLGNSDRLVVTPLTDRCYRTLMGAFALFYGGAPEGPAGTGKTESTKDLAKALAVQCVVFNCSDGLDYLAMGKFFKGLASSGAWCCFDEFNRINLEVLSVIAQQVATITWAIRARKDYFIFEDTELKLIPTCAVNITMNPGYAGRSELPDNLKALFRPCAMMVPDYALIGEIVLYSFGFGDAKFLSIKAVASLRLGSEQLSSQDHYDFGMRALKSILVAAGQLRRKFGSTRPEAVLMLMALNDVNLPKFTSNDIPLFKGITGDLLPGVQLPPSDYGQLIGELEGAAIGRNLQTKSTFIHKCTQLWETIMVRHGLMVVGMNVSGKTQVEYVLADALAAVADGDLYLPVEMHRMNPKSIKQGELYGDFDENTHEWTDGVLALTVRYTSNAGSTHRQWIMLDGPVDAVWIENMNTVLDDNKKLCLNSGEIIKLSPVSTMMFEVEDLAVASPATVSRCGMVFMEQVDIGWKVHVLSWLNTLPERLEEMKPFIKSLFEGNIETCWEMVQRKVKSPVPPTMNWITVNCIHLYWSLLRIELPLDPEEHKNDIPAKEKELKVENLFWLALTWSFGCTTDDEGRKIMNQAIRDVQSGEKVKEKYDLIVNDPDFRPVCKTPFPADGAVYDYYPNGQTNKWELWTKKIVGFDIPKDAQLHSITVPTADTVRQAFLLQTLVNSEYHVLFSGLTGTGKTVVIQQELLKGFDKQSYTFIAFAFSAQTTSKQTQEIIDGKLDKRKKGTYGPPLGKRCLVFVDDLNMPTKEIYGAQPPIELLRQWMDTGGWFERKGYEFRALVDLNFIGAMGPPGSRPFLTGRYQRHYNLIFVTPFETESLSRIFNTMLMWFLNRFTGAVSGAGQGTIKATIDLYAAMAAEMRPTPAKSHYTFNLRDIAKVVSGIGLCTKQSLESAEDLMKCWVHEVHRVFYDRLVSKDDQNWFLEKCKVLLKDNFKKDWKSLMKAECIVWCDFVDPKAEFYQEVTDNAKLIEVVNECLNDYNAMAKRRMDLVLFMAAAEHVCKIVRVLKTPLGNVLLVGVGGSGRKSLATLGIFQALQDEPFMIELTKSYGMNEWHDDMKRLLINCGGKNKEMCFLLSDTQIPNENFCEETSGLLNNGEIPNLFNTEDKTQIGELCTQAASQAGRHGPAEVFAFFVERCMKNLHIILALSPIGESFRRRVRMFPSLVNCCTIDWFHEWPDEALQSVAQYFLNELDMTADTRNGVIDVCVEMQKTMIVLTERYKTEASRYYYITPTSYLELINAFRSLLDKKRTEVSTVKSRYDIGLDKINSTESMVTTMQAELEELKPFLKKTAAETADLMVVIDKEQAEASKTEEIVSADEAAASQQAEEAGQMKADCQRDLDKAMPALQSAIEALSQLKKNDIVEVKAMGKPPDGVVLVSKALCWCFNVAPKKVTGPDGRTKVDDFWEPAKKQIWGDPKLLEKLMEYDKDNIAPSTIDKLKPLETDPAFEPDAVKKASVAACGICKWVRAMIVYDAVAKMVGPKKEALQEAEDSLNAAMSSLAEKKAMLKEVQDKVAKLMADLDAAKKKSEDLKKQFETCNKRLGTAEKLISGLGGEKTRWTVSSEDLGVKYTNLTGDILVSCGIIAYLGTFLAKYRSDAQEGWVNLMRARKIPASSEFALRTVIGEEVAIRQWVIDKLPNDQLSIDNALILANSTRWPLMIDPQVQANKWIKNGSKGLKVMRLTTPNYARLLEFAIANGEPVLIENIAETLDPLLDPLLKKEIAKVGSMQMIRVGDSQVEFHKDFKLYLTSKLPNPHYSPEICVQVTLLNFMVTPDGLQDQLLGYLVAKEEPEVEKKRVNLVIESAQSKAQLKELEDKILYLLSVSKGNILDDEELINTLATSKVTSVKIEERVKEQEKTGALVAQTRDNYVPVAVRCAAMFFVVADLCKVEPTYQYSLEWFVEIYLLAIKTAERPERNLPKRLQALQDRFIELVFQKVCDSLFAKDKLMYSLLLTFKSMEVDEELNMAEKALLLVGGTTGASIRPKPHSDWLMDVSWSRISELADLNDGPWEDFSDKFTEDLDDWQRVFDSDDPATEPWPRNFHKTMSPIQRSLVLLAVRTDQTIKGLQEIIDSKLGKEFLEPPSFNLDQVFGDSTNVMPLIFVLSSGADPMAELLKLAAKVDMTERKAAVSLGQGQGPKAEAAIREGKDQGMWVILQNCHLSVSWMPKLEATVEELDPDKVSPDFRLWLTAMPSKEFPVTVLQNSMKMTVEPPKGLKSNLLRAYASLDDDWFEESCNQTKECQHAFRKMLFGLFFFHGLIQERCNFGPLGWNIQYQFSEPDRQICTDQLRIFLQEQDPIIPYKALRYTSSEANYGGRVTDADDRVTIAVIITDFYCEDILKDSYKFSPSGIYYAPSFTSKEGYMEYVRGLPINQDPEIFGLHSNANLTCAIKEVTTMLATANSMQGKGGGGGGGKSSDEILGELGAKYLGEIKPPFDTEMSSAKYPVDYNESLNTVLNQELLRFNKLIVRVRASLVDICKAVKGLVVMDANLDDVAMGILRNTRPGFWMKVSFPSLKPLSGYVADLVARIAFLSLWVDEGHPPTYWLSGFFFTQSFLTGQLQNYARAKKLAIDTLGWSFTVLKKEFGNQESFTKPEYGCYIYGLFIEGARWCDDNGYLEESMPKVLFTEIPYMHWVPIIKAEDKTDPNTIYVSPLYKTSERKGVLATTGHSSNRVMSLSLKISERHTPKHWTKRGVACLCLLDD
eukprot:TRINITY_DN5109_c0_g5_i1.p1 TRINITY_DN5109_c0_g5~~TRINITY_DN5109_c0_g5_i1.p1  ORF type:complete len:4182 (+),score=1201.92 TRINITY_DN5109_c0_g5_i1:1381-13926(+)